MNIRKFFIFLHIIIFFLIFSVNIHASEIKADFTIEPINSSNIAAGELAAIKFRLTDSTTGAPVTSLRPAAWISLLRGDNKIPCKEKVSLFLKGTFVSGADFDLNRYFIITLNSDPTISVIDPFSGVKGLTQLYAMVILKSSGEDWVMDGKRLFVTMPAANQVAVIDTETFKVINNIDSGESPTKAAMQPDKKYLWVTNCTKKKQEAGITIIDPLELKVVARIKTEEGHHEMTFSNDSRYAYVSNTDNGNFSIIDTKDLRIIKEIKTGKSPVAVVVLAEKVYIAHEDGSILFMDSQNHKVSGEIKALPGLKGLILSPDGRWGFGINHRHGSVYVIDMLKDIIVHTISLNDPLHISFTMKNVYITGKSGQELNVIKLSDLGKADQPEMLNVHLGLIPAQRTASGHSQINTMFPAPEGDVMLISQPGVIQYFKEGMQAPMGSFRSYTKSLKAMSVVDRSIKETEAGIYTANIRIAESGRYEVAILFGASAVTECFEFTALPNPLLVKKGKGLKIEFLDIKKKVKIAEEVNFRFQLLDTVKNEPKENIEDVIVLASLAPGHRQERYRARPVGNGIYEVTVKPSSPGTYYISFSIPSLDVKSNQLDSFTLHAVEEGSPQ